MNIRYYFITDRITKKEAYVELCPTLDMIGDYFTKALHGSQFCRLSNTILVMYKDGIPDYNTSGRALIEEKKLKLNKEKEEYQKDSKLAGN